MKLPLTNDFLSIVLNSTTLIDVRAPIEFEKGAFKHSVNLPLLNDKERKLVGICYKKNGNEEAVKLGRSLVKGEKKDKRIQDWKKLILENKNTLIYCFRGGQRSQISQQWLNEIDIHVTRLEGGYKAFRNFLIKKSLEITSNISPIIIGGRTGSGKTIFLNKFENSIDLEGLANHRGSSFGDHVTKQPSQIDFENNLAYKLIKIEAKKSKFFLVEHENHNIGQCSIPKDLYDNLVKGKLIILKVPFQERVDTIYEEYVISSLKEYKIYFKNRHIQEWSEHIQTCLNKIKKRLGAKKYKEVQNLFNLALEEHMTHNFTSMHKEWIKFLLQEYYDPMYDYQIKKSKIPVIFEGNQKEIGDFLKNKN